LQRISKLIYRILNEKFIKNKAIKINKNLLSRPTILAPTFDMRRIYLLCRAGWRDLPVLEADSGTRPNPSSPCSSVGWNKTEAAFYYQMKHQAFAEIAAFANLKRVRVNYS
jgi:hypothetical protein